VTRQTVTVPPIVVARVDEVRRGVGRSVRVHFWEYAVWLLDDGSARVVDGYCEHMGGPLADGLVREGCVECPWHGWRYVLETGCRRTALGDLPGVASYRAWVDGDEIWADLPDDPLA